VRIRQLGSQYLLGDISHRGQPVGALSHRVEIGSVDHTPRIRWREKEKIKEKEIKEKTDRVNDRMNYDTNESSRVHSTSWCCVVLRNIVWYIVLICLN
jgi:hypothetical protein